MTPIALYDLDKTITRRPTYLPFLMHALWRHERWRIVLLPVLLPLFLGYAVRILDRGRLKEAMHALLLGSAVDAGKMAEIGESYAGKVLAENVYPQAIDRIARDRMQGRRLVMATASYEFYVAPLAEKLGFDDLIGTKVRHDEDGAILAKIDGENCYGAAKLRRVEAWAAEAGMAGDVRNVRFYSDSPTDLPVFDWASEPIATNPTSKLRRLAEKRGWRIFAWG
ncbi:HAD-IB family hydrolase [Parasphingopyxis marina]|uniref:HAD-IB family hydrolase n=1 Tax=Parasphingopyxis marina TaxID=2761622 RepID=A0A842HXN6_9SPHN|nr:HAD-IB family hydrolase [Parasphingopyxis marina]MBC2776700.1 HAD-IB family hydrolase [Parasphingopyxis marina]